MKDEECSWCNRKVKVLEVSPDERRFKPHNAKNGRPCYNAWGLATGELTIHSTTEEQERIAKDRAAFVDEYCRRKG